MLAIGRLLRLSLAPSALADIAAGIVLGAGFWPQGGAPFLLMAASSCVYHGGMALNDWADRHEDARSGRPRPIPSGAISPRTALACAVGLLLLGPVLAALAAPRAAAVLVVVAALAAFYDLRGRGPWLGPLLLATCRAGNLATGILFGWGAAEASIRPSPERSALDGIAFFISPVVYGLYVFCVSRLARLEDCSPEELSRARPARWLRLAAQELRVLGVVSLLVLLATGRFLSDREGGKVLLVGSVVVGALIAAFGALGLATRSQQTTPWTHKDVEQAAGMGLRRLLIATSAIAAGSGTRDGLLIAAAILLGYPLSYGLRKVFPPS